MHLIVTRADLGTFAHIHPEPTGTPGELTVTTTFPTAGPVRRAHRVPPPGPDGRRARHRTSVTVAGPRARHAGGRAPARRWRTVDRCTVSASPCAATRQRRRDQRLRPPVHRRRHRPPGRRTCSPTSARPATSSIMRADGSGFAHEHAETVDDAGRPVFAAARHHVRSRPGPARPVRPPRHLPAVGPVPARRRHRDHRPVHRPRRHVSRPFSRRRSWHDDRITASWAPPPSPPSAATLTLLPQGLSGASRSRPSSSASPRPRRPSSASSPAHRRPPSPAAPSWDSLSAGSSSAGGRPASPAAPSDGPTCRRHSSAPPASRSSPWSPTRGPWKS